MILANVKQTAIEIMSVSIFLHVKIYPILIQLSRLKRTNTVSTESNETEHIFSYIIYGFTLQ